MSFVLAFLNGSLGEQGLSCQCHCRGHGPESHSRLRKVHLKTSEGCGTLCGWAGEETQVEDPPLDADGL